MNLFVYGALMYDEVWSRIVSGNFERIPAELRGYRRMAVTGEEYPGTIEGSGTITGCVWLNVDRENLERLDEFEGEYYERIPSVAYDNSGTSLTVNFYHFKKQYQHLLADQEWDVEQFAKSGIMLFISKYAGFKN